METGFRWRRIFACGSLLLAACSEARASLLQYSLSAGPYSFTLEPRSLFLIGAGLALLALLIQGKPGIRR